MERCTEVCEHREVWGLLSVFFFFTKFECLCLYKKKVLIPHLNFSCYGPLINL